MAQLREIKNRIKAVANIQRITRTMQMIATAKFQASLRRAEASKPYTQKLGEVVGEVAESTESEHPLLASPAERRGRELMLVLSSNRGLAGAYNANVLRTASGYLRRQLGDRFELDVVGKKGIAFFRFANVPITRSYTHFTDKVAYAEVEQLAGDYIARFVAGEFDAVRVTYMRFISNSRQEPQVLRLLPLRRPEAAAGEPRGGRGLRTVYEFSPDPQTLLDALLPLTVKAQLFQCFNEAVVSEQIARMVAMKSATDNAAKMGRGLRRAFNRARQAQITTELSEIIGGAAALE